VINLLVAVERISEEANRGAKVKKKVQALQIVHFSKLKVRAPSQGGRCEFPNDG
jgi:hypothetical protein